MNIEQYIVYI